MYLILQTFLPLCFWGSHCLGHLSLVPAQHSRTRSQFSHPNPGLTEPVEGISTRVMLCLMPARVVHRSPSLLVSPGAQKLILAPNIPFSSGREGREQPASVPAKLLCCSLPLSSRDSASPLPIPTALSEGPVEILRGTGPQEPSCQERVLKDRSNMVAPAERQRITHLISLSLLSTEILPIELVNSL